MAEKQNNLIMGRMKSSLLKGFSFGLTSGIITTLGMIVGLHSFSGSRLVVIGGILTIAVADSLSDALGVHISEESTTSSHKAVWHVTFAALISKVFFTLTFLLPIFFLPLREAVWVDIAWGISLLCVLNYFIAKNKKESPFRMILEHVSIAVFVLVATYFLGGWIAVTFQ